MGYISTEIIFQCTNGAVEFLRVGRGTGDPPHFPKNWLITPHFFPLLGAKNVDFVIFMQFLGILPKMSPLVEP